MAKPSIAVVIATNRPEAFALWYEAWKHELTIDTTVFVVEDQPRKSAELAWLSSPRGWHHVAWDDIEEEFPQDHWIFPRRSSAIKSYGFWLARDYDVIWTLDDDCFPEPNFSGRYLDLLTNFLTAEHETRSWYNTIGNTGLYPRGYPYGIRHETRPTMIHHGLWSGVPDLDGVTALEHHEFRMQTTDWAEVITEGQMFPMCGMNLAFRREMLPAMYFMLMGQAIERDNGGSPELTPLPFDRFDDIWAGLFAKKIADHFGWAVTSGMPSIIHTKLSDPTMRVLKEAPGIAAHEILWKHVANWDISGAETVSEAYCRLAECVYDQQHDPVLKQWDGYWIKLSRAMEKWAGLFS